LEDGNECGKTKIMRTSREPSPVQIMIDHIEMRHVDYNCFRYLGSMMTNNARRTHEIKTRVAMAKAAFNRKITPFTRKLDLNLRMKLVKCYIWSIDLYCAETWTFC
jgi:hypothetical protein